MYAIFFKWSCFLSVCIFSSHAYAQQRITTDSVTTKESIGVLAKPSLDSIVLRWAPLSLSVWQRANTLGYTLERYVILRDGKIISPPEKIILTTQALKPLPEADWELLVQQNRYAAIAAQALFGDSFEINMGTADVISIVNKVRENEQRFSFALFCADMSPAVAKASALWFTDRTVKRNEKYLYRIKLNDSTDSIRGSVFISPTETFPMPAPANVEVTSEEHSVSLKWRRSALANYTAYLVERSPDGKTFHPIDEIPLVNMSPEGAQLSDVEYATDSLPDLSQTYFYRIKGITPFGETSEPSEVVRIKGTYTLYNVPVIYTGDNLNNTALQIVWRIEPDDEKRIQGFKVKRSTKANGTYENLTPALLPTDTRTFIDTNPMQVGYYKVIAEGFAGEQKESPPYLLQLIDSIPPSPPTGLLGTIDEFGNVTLQWTPNKEQDLYGYRVYRTNFTDEELALLTAAPIQQEGYADKVGVNTLNEAIYYSITALDRNQNQSGLSALLEIPLPDKVKPQPPVFLPVKNSEAGVELRWLPSGSTDVVRYDVYRKITDRAEWQRIKSISATKDSSYQFIDTYASVDKLSSYTVVAVDDANLESPPSVAVNGKKINNDLAPPIKWKESIVDVEKRVITLQWICEHPTVRSFKIYKSDDNGSETLYRTIPGDVREFNDRLILGKSLSYRIFYLLDNSKISEGSEKITID